MVLMVGASGLVGGASSGSKVQVGVVEEAYVEVHITCGKSTSSRWCQRKLS